MVTRNRPGGSLSEPIRRFVEEELRPAIREDGGDIGFDRLDGSTVCLYMGAACSTCPARSRTVKHVIERRIRERFANSLSVRVRVVKPYFSV